MSSSWLWLQAINSQFIFISRKWHSKYWLFLAKTMKFYYTWGNKCKIPVNILFPNFTIAVSVCRLQLFVMSEYKTFWSEKSLAKKYVWFSKLVFSFYVLSPSSPGLCRATWFRNYAIKLQTPNQSLKRLHFWNRSTTFAANVERSAAKKYGSQQVFCQSLGGVWTSLSHGSMKHYTRANQAE